MKIQLRKYAAGDKFWYSNINDYDPTKYLGEWDYEKGVIAGDTKTRRMPAWTSRVAGLDPGRYAPTDLSPEYGTMGVGQNHYNYALSVEGLNWYKYNTDSMFDANNNLTDFGKWWILKTDDLLPVGHNARIFNSDGSIKNSITVKLNDAQGRAPVVKTFNLRNPQELKDYILHTRKDLTIGGRHNVAVLKGKRYFYVDNEGKYHWVSPEEAVKYNVSEKPVEEGWDEDPNKRIYWLDYELMGPKDPNNPIEEEKKGLVPAIGGKRYGFDWNKISAVGLKIFGNPELYAFGRLAGNLLNNERVYDEQLKGIKPVLRLTYNTHRQVVGDEATKLAYYRRAAQGLTKAARPFTSDADRLMAYQFEAKRIGDELRAQGDLADNQEIRRTSDESNQHLWANTLRATEVANTNLASINQANALKHNLLALKHSALWSSIDNFLKGIEYRKRQKLAEQQAFDDLIFALQEQQDLLNDPEYLLAYKTYSDIIKAHTDPTTGSIDINNEEIVEAKRKFLQAQTDAAIRSYQRRKQYYLNRGTIYAKSGTKITHKKKDDLLYKSTKDVVEHFRKMSKIASDALDRKKPKIEKLTSHPKGKTKKYLLGGVAPFTVYTPVALGGETTTSTELGTSRTSKSSSSKDSDGLDLMKELFKSLSVEGLPSDVNGIYQAMNNLMLRQYLFGTELSSSDVASMYLQLMLKINTIKFNKALFDKTAEAVNSKDAGSEFAIDLYGRVAVQNTESGKVEYKKWDELKSDLNKEESKFNPLTNNDLLNLRAYSPSEAFSVNLLLVASNATSMTEIAKFLKDQLPNISSSESTIEGYTKQDSNLIKAGLQLLKDAPAGDYKFTLYSKDLLKQAQMALGYLKSILPKNMKTLLQVNSEMQGIPADSIIASMIGSTLNENSKLEFDAVTGKASKDANGNSKESGDGLKLDAATALISGKGYLGAIEFNPGTSYAVTVNARHSGFLKKSGENMGSGITMLEATTSTLDKVLDWNKATLGGSRLNPTGYNRIMINNDDVVGVDLPVGSDKNTPDFTMLLKLQVLDLELLKKGIEDTPNNWKQVNQVCLEIGLPAKYKNDGSLNEYSWNRFAAFQVTADDSVLVDKNAILSDILGVVEDDNVREQYELIILKDNKNYKLGSGFLGLGKQALYLGTVFVPINSNYVASALSGGLNISMLQATNLELRERGYDLLKIATYKPGININEL